MAIFSGIISRLRGSVENLTFVRVGGKTVVRKKVERKATPSRSRRQMKHRVVFCNLVNVYRAFTGKLHPSFENKAEGRSDYNEFMSANLGSNGVALKASDARQGGCVVAGYQVTRGSLPSVVVSFGEGQVPVTDIDLGGMTIGASTTLATFSQAVVENNDGWMQGDQLTVFVAHQLLDSITGVPRVTIVGKELTLDVADDSTLLGDVLDANFLAAVDGKLAMGGPVNGAVAVVHSRLTKSGTRVSTQFFVVNNPMLSQYQTDEAFEAAMASYGLAGGDDFLTPNVDEPSAEA